MSERPGRSASAAAMRSGRIGCGEVITKSTTLTADVGPCPGNGIIIGADNIRLNLNGHTVSGTPGPGSGNDAGIRLPKRTGVRITGQPGSSGRKGTVTGFDAGVVVNGGSGNTVENLTVRDNVGPLLQDAPLGDGVAIFESANNRILNNDILRNGLYDGVSILGLGADNNVVQGNVVAEGVNVDETRGTFSAGGAGIVMNNVLDVNTMVPIRGNRVLDNTVRDNPSSGVSNVANVDGVIARNRVERNGLQFFGVDDFRPGHGIGVQGGPGLPDDSMRVLVEGNVTNENGIAGIILVGNTDDNLVRENQSFRNGVAGIAVTLGRRNDPSLVPDHNSIVNNDTGYNQVVDLLDGSGGFVDCGTNEWFGNTWGPLSTRAAEFGLSTMYFPECTGTGGSGPS